MPPIKPPRPPSPFGAKELSDESALALAELLARAHAPWWSRLPRAAARLFLRRRAAPGEARSQAYAGMAGLVLNDRWGWEALDRGKLGPSFPEAERQAAKKAIRVVAKQRKERLGSLNGSFLVVPPGLISLSVATRLFELAWRDGADPNWTPAPGAPKLGELVFLCQWIFSDHPIAAAMAAAEPAMLGQWHALMMARDIELSLSDPHPAMAPLKSPARL